MIGHAKSSEFSLSALNKLRNKGVEDISIFCVEGLNEFKEAMQATVSNIMDTTIKSGQVRSSFSTLLLKHL